MPHLTDDDVLRLARSPGGTRDALQGLRAHLQACASCSARVAGTERLASVLKGAEAEVRPPSFDELVAPALAAQQAPDAGGGARALSAAGAARLVAALLLRQARQVPIALWPLTGLGLAALLAFVWRVPDPVFGALAFGLGVTLLTVGAALVVCSPRRSPGAEMMHAMRVGPAVVWLVRLAFVTGAVLAASAGASVAAAVLSGAPQDAAALIASWLGPALLGTALTAFGTVWRAPAVGAAMGLGSWLMSVAIALNGGWIGALPGPVSATIGPLWTTTPPNLVLTAVILAAAVWLVSRPDRSLAAD
ncbi:hypothetical protein HNR23_004774 [Nocardiopsis mwathae]|uniref:Zinc-finger domain-containing protein n=1 Tax=Nocardiopsis mwathae TaxID=1472723 RepID=A0A7W9YM75_9ACTN|nr:hypothetical protein [Nocardiopsis mwathae]MBB6174714.1 hypothetical protein [Nocardiopsis mwathae]